MYTFTNISPEKGSAGNAEGKAKGGADLFKRLPGSGMRFEEICEKLSLFGRRSRDPSKRR